MSKKKRPNSDKNLVRRQAAASRRGAPGGKRYVGGTSAQSRRAKREEVARVYRMAEVDAARREAEVPLPLTAVLAQLLDDAVGLARALASAPFRIAVAFVTGRAETRDGQKLGPITA